MIGVVSDVHANLPALEAVFGRLDELGVQRVWCLGDTLGYGPNPAECLALITARCEIVLAGNHDLAVRGDLDERVFRGTAAAGVRHARAQLGAEGIDTTRGWKTARVLEDLGVEMYHGSARDPVWEYVLSTSDALKHFTMQRLQLGMVGHSHLQLAFQLDSAGTVDGGPAIGAHIPIGQSAKTLINPGSVGQPRDGDPRAAFALIVEGGVQMQRVEYDIARAQADIARVGLPAETGTRLAAGR